MRIPLFTPLTVGVIMARTYIITSYELICSIPAAKIANPPPGYSSPVRKSNGHQKPRRINEANLDELRRHIASGVKVSILSELCGRCERGTMNLLVQLTIKEAGRRGKVVIDYRAEDPMADETAEARRHLKTLSEDGWPEPGPDRELALRINAELQNLMRYRIDQAYLLLWAGGEDNRDFTDFLTQAAERRREFLAINQ